MFVEPRLMNEIILRSTNLNESPIDEFNTTLKLEHIQCIGLEQSPMC